MKIFSLSEMKKATNNFSGANKISEGRFSTIYMVICIVDHFNSGNLVSFFPQKKKSCAPTRLGAPIVPKQLEKSLKIPSEIL